MIGITSDSAGLKTLKRETYIEGSAWALMVHFAESSAVIFFSTTQLTSIQLAMLMTLPTAVGALIQGLVPQLSFFARFSPRTMTLGCVIVQILGLCVMCLSLQNATLNLNLMLIGMSVYFAGGMTAGGPWQEWISALVPLSNQNRFFSERSGFISLAMLLGYLLIGYVLRQQINTSVVQVLIACSILFRFVSLRMLFKHPLQPPSKPTMPDLFGNFDIQVSLGMMCLIGFVFKFAVHLPAPFYSQYMLKELNFDILTFAVINSIPLAARFFLLRKWGHILDQKRVYEALFICIVGIAIVPILWTLSVNSMYIGFLQIISGIVWSGFELVMVLYLQKLYPGSITKSLSLYGAVGAIGAVLGATLGGSFRDSGMTFHALFTYATLFRIIGGACFLLYLRSRGGFRFRKLEVWNSLTTLLSLRGYRNIF